MLPKSWQRIYKLTLQGIVPILNHWKRYFTLNGNEEVITFLSHSQTLGFLWGFSGVIVGRRYGIRKHFPTLMSLLLKDGYDILSDYQSEISNEDWDILQESVNSFKKNSVDIENYYYKKSGSGEMTAGFYLAHLKNLVESENIIRDLEEVNYFDTTKYYFMVKDLPDDVLFSPGLPLESVYTKN